MFYFTTNLVTYQGCEKQQGNSSSYIYLTRARLFTTFITNRKRTYRTKDFVTFQLVERDWGGERSFNMRTAIKSANPSSPYKALSILKDLASGAMKKGYDF